MENHGRHRCFARRCARPQSLLLRCVWAWAGRCATRFFRQNRAKKPKISAKAEFSAEIRRKRAAGGWVAAQRYGKLRVRLSLCAQVCAAATLFKGRATRFFRQNRAKKPKISTKTDFSAGIGQKRAAGGWVTAQRYGKLRVRLSLCAQVCAAG